jgi:hypothetical protein
LDLFLGPSFKHFAVGGSIALVLVLAFAVGQRILRDEPPRPREWLTESEQEELAELVSTWEPDRWVAGCLWEQRHGSDITELVDAPGNASRWSKKTTAGRDISLLLVENVLRPSSNYDEIEAPGAFCYVPDKSRLMMEAWHGCARA